MHEGGLASPKRGGPKRVPISIVPKRAASSDEILSLGAFCQGMLGLESFLPTNGFSMKPLKVKLGE